MHFKSLLNEYRENTGRYFLEEPCDFLIFRPIAYCIVKLTYWIPFTPNHFSLMALIVALFSGYSLSIGTAAGFFWGGVGIFIFSVLDCCDGMLARMKKNGSKYGDLIDMFVDLISNFSFFTGLFLGIVSQDYFIPLQILVVASASFILIHASLYNFYKKMYKFYAEKKPDGMRREVENWKRDLSTLKNNKGNLFNKLILVTFIKFSTMQTKDKDVSSYDVARYNEFNKITLPLWGIISGSSHLALLSISLMTFRLGIFFFFSIIIFNIWFAFIFIIQTGVNDNLTVTK